MAGIFQLHLPFLSSPLQLASFAKVPSIQKENAGMFHSSLLSIILLFMLSLLSKADGNAPYTGSCPTTYKCGASNYNVGPPFWLPDWPGDNCSHPGFELACDQDKSILTINIRDKTYQIKSINYENKVLTVIDPDLSGEECPQAFTDPISSSSIFSYPSLKINLYFYFNCSFDDHSIDLLHRINCAKEEIQLDSYYSFFELPLSDLPGNCILYANFSINETLDSLEEMNFTEVMQVGISVTWTVEQQGCEGCQDSVYTGENSSNRKVGRTIGIGSAAGTGGLLLACLLWFLYLLQHKKVPSSIFFWKKKLDNSQNIEAFLERFGSVAPKRYRYTDVRKITRNFRDKLGQGGYGTVFKGSLMEGCLVAVKILSDSKGDGEEFLNEVASIGRTSHVNIVSLLGFCSEGSKRALIYEFMPNGSLEKYIYSEKLTLGWEILYQIAFGIAHGLAYLHRGCNTRIVHFDIKPQNILLDQDFCPKISDFGLAKLCPPKISILSMADPRGTIGYIAPEVFSRNFGVVSSKSDVYSYGMMILEIVGGRKKTDVGVEKSSEIYFPDRIYEHLEQGGDLQDYGVTEETEDVAKKMIFVGLWCIQTRPENRPSMSKVVDMLQGSQSAIQLPPKPYLSSPQGSLINSLIEIASGDDTGKNAEV